MGRPDEIVAAEALANHLRCNNSFVHGLFQAQYRSSLTCPSCQKQSTTFDPFLCISIPIPQRQYRPVYVTVVYLNQKPRQVRNRHFLSCTSLIKPILDVPLRAILHQRLNEWESIGALVFVRNITSLYCKVQFDWQDGDLNFKLQTGRILVHSLNAEL